MTTTSAERALVLRAQSGDREALDRLLRELAPGLLRYARRLMGGSAAAEDVVQETLIAVARKLGWLREPSLFRPWAYRIASRIAFRVLKVRRSEAPLEEIEAPAEEPLDPLVRERLLAAVDRLTPASRAVIHLHYLEEMPLSEVAAVLELPSGTVKSRLAAGLAQLRKETLP